jgi:hypothetical protein
MQQVGTETQFLASRMRSWHERGFSGKAINRQELMDGGMEQSHALAFRFQDARQVERECLAY